MTDDRNSKNNRQVPHQPRTLAVTGGKGGVGKTSVVLNLALILAREGNRVLLLDGDTDLANVSIMLGRYPGRTLEHVVEGECGIDDVIMEAPFGLHIIPGASGVQQCMEMASDDSFSLLRELARLEKRYDYVLIDTAAGLQSVGLHMIAAAALACIVLTPDPTSLTDAFSLIKVLKRRGYQRVPSVLVNMAQGASQAQSVFQRFSAATQRHLGVRPHYLGAIWRDETLRQSIQNQHPVALMPTSDPSCRQFQTLADMLRVRFDQVPQRRAGVAAYWHHVSQRASQSRAKKPEPMTECQRLIGELSALLEPGAGEPQKDLAMLRYEAFNGLFALLGRTLNDDAIEIIQTGLASLPWESLPQRPRQVLAEHLRQLADQVGPPQNVSAGAREASRETPPEPRYDRVSFGEQSRLIQVLREQPADVSLDQLLRSLVGGSNSSS